MWLFAPKLLGRFGSLSFLESFLQIWIWLYQRCTFSSWFAEFPVTQAPIWISSVLCLLNALRGLHNVFHVNTDRSDPYSFYSKHTAYDFGHLTFSAEHPISLNHYTGAEGAGYEWKCSEHLAFFFGQMFTRCSLHFRNVLNIFSPISVFRTPPKVD